MGHMASLSFVTTGRHACFQQKSSAFGTIVQRFLSPIEVMNREDRPGIQVFQQVEIQDGSVERDPLALVPQIVSEQPFCLQLRLS